MRILAINSSHRGKKGKTQFFLERIFHGAQGAGAECQLATLAELKINRCLGCRECQASQHHLQCVYHDKDGARWVFEQMAAADLLIFATPIYMMNMTGLMKTLLDRLFSTMDAADGRLSESGLIHHHIDPAISSKPFVSLTVCANLETESSKAVPAYFHTYSRFMNAPQAGVLVRNGADLFGGLEDPATTARFPKMLDVVEAYEQAGRELATLGHIRRATQRRANQEVVSLPMFWLLKRFRPVKKLIIEQAKQYV
jgi:multimeric flavodoxin WrbA